MKKMSNKKRNVIRIIGITLFIIGIMLVIFGFDSFETTAFIIGGFIVIIGWFLIRIGFSGKLHELQTSETVETNARAKNYILGETKENLKEILGNNESPKRICKSCGAINDINNNYCFDCGIQIKKNKGVK